MLEEDKDYRLRMGDAVEYGWIASILRTLEGYSDSDDVHEPDHSSEPKKEAAPSKSSDNADEQEEPSKARDPEQSSDRDEPSKRGEPEQPETSKNIQTSDNSISAAATTVVKLPSPLAKRSVENISRTTSPPPTSKASEQSKSTTLTDSDSQARYTKHAHKKMKISG